MNWRARGIQFTIFCLAVFCSSVKIKLNLESHSTRNRLFLQKGITRYCKREQGWAICRSKKAQTIEANVYVYIKKLETTKIEQKRNAFMQTKCTFNALWQIQNVCSINNFVCTGNKKSNRATCCNYPNKTFSEIIVWGHVSTILIAAADRDVLISTLSSDNNIIMTVLDKNNPLSKCPY